jgi:hypothetical protein
MYRSLKFLLPLALVSAGCTTVPEPSPDFASPASALSPAQGVRARHLATPAPNPPVETGAVLIIRDVAFTQAVATSTQISPEHRAIIANALARNACSDLSSLFEISDGTATDAFSLQIRISQLTPTNEVSALVGQASGYLLPGLPVSVRPPIGLGSLSAEFELFRPDGSLAAAMLWSQNADMVSDARVSPIGDAYESTAAATSEFAGLVQDQNAAQRLGNSIGSMFGANADPACERYGEGEGLLGSILPLPPRAAPAPPENSVPPEPSRPSPLSPPVL